MGTVGRAQARLHTFAVRFAVLAFAAVLAVAVATGTADAAKVAVLGSGPSAAPACPGSPCQAVGKTTGFQTSIGKRKKPFVATSDGSIVAWSIKLSAPNDSQTQFFNKFYGGPPQARIAILKPLKRARGRLKLKAQGPVEELTPVLGATTTFTLNQPLPIRAGQIAALGIKTWAPAFGVGLGKTNTWRASRKKAKCARAEDIQASTTHDVIGSERAYGCEYSTARILYSATMVSRAARKRPAKKPAP